MAFILLVLALLASSSCGEDSGSRDTERRVAANGNSGFTGDTDGRAVRLAQVDSWFYYLSFDPEDDTFSRLAESSYDMVVMEPIFTEVENTDFDSAAIVQNLHGADNPKLVIAYIDIGQAEEWRTYWEPGWEIGDPDWIVGNDPDGWEGNFPVAYWRDEWKGIWLDDDGYLQRLIDAGFDGVYLDWVEAYSDDNVMTAAENDGVDPEQEMIDFVAEIAERGREQDDMFFVIAQNAAELAEDDAYLETIDAIAQEQVWFDGAADNDPPGDCPLPRTEADIESPAYVESLSEECRRVYEEFPDSTLYVSSESYLEYLELARDAGITVFTVDYALDDDNVAWVYDTSRSYGFIPFVGERELASYIEPYSAGEDE